jgi:hypothetical protein
VNLIVKRDDLRKRIRRTKPGSGINYLLFVIPWGMNFQSPAKKIDFGNSYYLAAIIESM